MRLSAAPLEFVVFRYRGPQRSANYLAQPAHTPASPGTRSCPAAARCLRAVLRAPPTSTATPRAPDGRREPCHRRGLDADDRRPAHDVFGPGKADSCCNYEQEEACPDRDQSTQKHRANCALRRTACPPSCCSGLTHASVHHCRLRQSGCTLGRLSRAEGAAWQPRKINGS